MGRGGPRERGKWEREGKGGKGRGGVGARERVERGWKQNQREGREGRREGREEGRRGYEEKSQIQFKSAKQCWRREEEEENQKEEEEERSKNRKRGPEERGREGEWEDRGENCPIHQQGKA